MGALGFTSSMGLFFKLIRPLLGFFILKFDRMTAPRPPFRTPEEQRKLDAATAHLTLYQLEACPFCVKVRREILRRGLHVRMKDIKRDPVAAEELLAGGKIDQGPCLRIDSKAGSHWMYESSEIISYLGKEYPLQGTNAETAKA